ncbi:hypothetical protein ROLI_010480 [Roseobacter fucihabitans]|uniref:Twin-arginine translocation signal domain-containing protein n=1 Tax=Roseobacter fucihabitans TaxID=1537242 RepID=A0ABZ2BPU3_9RHOB|nr:hypothetical protein [Roseobacter litoralis]MBC6965509.1 hypothetical protein [Roseobacter litoralis]
MVPRSGTLTRRGFIIAGMAIAGGASPLAAFV